MKNNNRINNNRIIGFVIIVVIICGILIYEYYIKNQQFEKYDDPKIDNLKNRLSNVFPEINHIQLSGSNKSFTINKKEIYLCLKDKNGNYYDDNMLIYVLLHELAHVKCDEIGHTEKFKTIFKSLLQKAELAGIYNPYQPPIDNYCNF